MANSNGLCLPERFLTAEAVGKFATLQTIVVEAGVGLVKFTVTSTVLLTTQGAGNSMQFKSLYRNRSKQKVVLESEVRFNGIANQCADDYVHQYMSMLELTSHIPSLTHMMGIDGL